MATHEQLRELVAEVAAAYFRNSHVSPAEIPTVIGQIASSLEAVPEDRTATATAAAPATATAMREERHFATDRDPGETERDEARRARRAAASRVRASITYAALISFEDNKPYKNLRPHLAARGLTPESYRTKWGLPPDYPMVAQSYSETRSQIAKSMKLGSRGTAARQQIRAGGRGARTGAPGRRRRTPANGKS
jgi:predicted transcriptional regulator